MAYAPPPKPRTVLPILGGIFLIIAGLDGIGTWAFVAFLGTLTSGVGFGFLGGILVACGAIGIIFGIIALLGGIMAIMRRMWALALIGGILGLFLVGSGALVMGVLFPEASVFALIGLILVAISHKEF
ncbi:MAG: hypothetical protein A3K65_08515 [Euryarchaeota archaeon RBG_16_68_12]|nr:MAG: hypothetical protein A3K65_08515 [Euryarchaeota archaeon RBG_16_68_12]